MGEEAFVFGSIAGLDLDHPAMLVGRFDDDVEVVFEFFVDLDDVSIDRRSEFTARRWSTE